MYFEAELPGVAEKDLEITVHKGVLTVKGECRDEEGRDVHVSTAEDLVRSSGWSPFPRRSIQSRWTQRLTGGILRIRLPKLPQARPRKIALKTS